MQSLLSTKPTVQLTQKMQQSVPLVRPNFFLSRQNSVAEKMPSMSVFFFFLLVLGEGNGPWDRVRATNYLSLSNGVAKKVLTDFDSSLFEHQSCARFTFQLYLFHEKRHFNKLNKLSWMDHTGCILEPQCLAGVRPRYGLSFLVSSNPCDCSVHARVHRYFSFVWR